MTHKQKYFGKKIRKRNQNLIGKFGKMHVVGDVAKVFFILKSERGPRKSIYIF